MVGIYVYMDSMYEGKIFPMVTIDTIPFGGKTPHDVETYWMEKNKTFGRVLYSFTSDTIIATLSGELLDMGYDATLSGAQAYSIGRSDSLFSNINFRFFTKNVNLPPSFTYNEKILTETISSLSARLNESPKEALFQFSGGKVTAFQASKPGKQVQEEEIYKLFLSSLPHVAKGTLTEITIPIPVETVEPTVTTDAVNSFGIKERIGLGYSEFAGSIQGRIHNVLLAASKLHGVLIKPGEVFSFNNTVGDISAATGYQSAYIIKDGKTVMGDGGGVCQVSTTLFRAALNAGLPIVERHEHSYRVHYYEEGGFKPGIDATVYNPTDDLKFKNDTPGYVLIQTSHNLRVPSLTFELYGTSDGRKAEILNQKLWGQTPPPPALYQDDPTLPAGTVKQVDFAAWGAKASFEYKVTRNGEILTDRTFTSNYRPWQAVYLQGTKQ